jgi:hypothetical protein
MNQLKAGKKGGERGSGPSLEEGQPSVSSDQEAVERGIRREVLASAELAAGLAAHLQGLAEVAVEITTEVGGRASADELARQANALRGLVTQGLTALAKLQAEAGRWEGVAIAQRLVTASRQS